MATLERRVSGWSLVFALSRSLVSSGEAGVSWAVVTQIRFPSITGEDHPRPGRDVFQTTFDVSLQAVGRFRAEAGACPCPPGPRHSGHSGGAAMRVREEPSRNVRKTEQGFMGRDRNGAGICGKLGCGKPGCTRRIAGVDPYPGKATKGPDREPVRNDRLRHESRKGTPALFISWPRGH